MMDANQMIIEKGLSGFASISDIHSEYRKLNDALEFCKDNSLLPVILGDLLDGISDDHIPVLDVIHRMLSSGTGILVIGNHDDKHYRYAQGNNVQMNGCYSATVSAIKPKKKKYRKLMCDIMEHYAASMVHTCTDNIVFTHAAISPDYWISGHASKKFSLYGQVTGERDENDLPVRLHDWANDVPRGKTVIVGHDRSAMDKSPLEPLIYFNDVGGAVYYTDTSCGKRPDGKLTCTVFHLVNSTYAFHKFVKF